MNNKNLSQKRALENTATHVSQNEKLISKMQAQIDRLAKSQKEMAVETNQVTDSICKIHNENHADLEAKIGALTLIVRRIGYGAAVGFFVVAALHLLGI